MSDILSRHTRSKVHLLHLAFSPQKFSGLASAIFDNKPEEASRIQRSLDHYYSKNGNTSSIEIPKQLIERWNFQVAQPADLLYGTVLEFAQAMPREILDRVLGDARHRDVLTPEDLEFLRLPTKREAPRLHPHGMGRGYHVVHVTPAYDTGDITEALDKGEFDQKYLYLDRTAATRWEKLTINPDRYGTFRSCMDTLEELVGGEPWTSLVPEIETVVVLGGGAAKKDDKIIQSLIANRGTASHPVQFVVIDTSIHMLLSTLRELEKLVDHRHASFLEVTGFVADFTTLRETLRILSREGADIHRCGLRAVFFLPGNTLANFDPELMFENIWDNSSAKDLFLLSVETVRNGREDDLSSELEKRYRQRDLVNLVLPPIRPFLDLKQIDMIGDKALDKIKSKPIKGHWSGLHYFRDAITIEIRLKDEAAGVDVVLATSSRYYLKTLQGAARWMGFEPIHSAEVNFKNYDHHQLLLERQPVRHSPHVSDK